jgi:hypothetical protein
MLCRPNNAWIGIFLVVVMSVVSALVSVRGHDPLVARRVLVGFGAIAVVCMAASMSDGGLRTRNAVQVIEHRIFGTPEEQWFIARGMPPDGPSILEAAPDPARGVSAMIVLLEDPDFGAWARRDASSSYTRFVVEHPRWVLDTAIGDRSAYRGLASGSVYAVSRRVVPEPVEALVWPPGRPAFAAVLAVAGAGIVAGPLRERRRPVQRRRLALAAAVLAAVAMDAAFVLLSAGDEYPRLLLVPAVLARVALLWLVLAGAPTGQDGLRGDVRPEAGGVRAAGRV